MFFLTLMSPIKPFGLTLETKTIPLCPLYDFRAEIRREHLPHPPLGNITFEEEPDLIHPPFKEIEPGKNDLSGKIIPLFKTYQDWEKKIIFEPFDRENLAGQPTILVR